MASMWCGIALRACDGVLLDRMIDCLNRPFCFPSRSEVHDASGGRDLADIISGTQKMDNTQKKIPRTLLVTEKETIAIA
jgi:hypothetical protein